MKKIFLTIVGVVSFSSMVFAGNLYDPTRDQTLSAPQPVSAKPQAQPVKAKAAVKSSEAQTRALVGTVEVIVAANSAKGTKGALTVVDASGAKTVFALPSGFTASLMKGEKVQVKYFVTNEGSNEATEVVVAQ